MTKIDQNRYDIIRKVLYKHTGIKLDESKDVMIANRLDKLQRKLAHLGDIDAILKEVSEGRNTEEFINTFTTNKTHFFREAFHFEDLKNRVLPKTLKENLETNIYCSASSTGEEPYSIAMSVLRAREEQGLPNAKVKILATDIDTGVLEKAKNGIYAFSPHRHDFPSWANPNKYFKRRLEGNSDEFLIKAKDEMKALLTFGQINLMAPSLPLKPESFDVVFCRNVLIYFSVEDQNKILAKLFALIKPGGTLYLGHSENPLDLAPFVERLGNNIFVKKA
jgi:chemotaxis protein methyltransferase CheR